MFKRSELTKMTKADIADHIASNHDLAIDPDKATKEDLIEKLYALEGVAEDGDDDGSEQASDEIAETERPSHVTVNVFEMPNTPKDVHIIVDGYPRQFLKGKDVKLPYKVFTALDEAREITYEPKTNEDGHTVMEPTEAHTYPFGIVERHFEE